MPHEFGPKLKDGIVQLDMGNMRAGHWPGLKAPPWGLQHDDTLKRIAGEKGLDWKEVVFPGRILDVDGRGGTVPVAVKARRYNEQPGTESFFASPVGELPPAVE